MGGTIVQAIAAKYPQEISKIGILVSAVKWRKAVLNFMDISIKMQEQNVNPEIISTFFESILLGEECLLNTMFMQEFRNINNTNPHPQLLFDQKRQFRALLDFDGNNLLPKIKSPALVLYGKQDILALPEESKHLASKIPHAKLVALDCGHMIALEKPDELTQELLDFLI